MNYAITNLTAVVDCDFLINMAKQERSDLDLRKINHEHAADKFSGTAAEIEAIYQGVLSDLAFTEQYIQTLPEGVAKTEALRRKKRLDIRKLTLETRRDTYGTVAYLEKQMDLARVQQEIAEVDAFISAVEVRKAALA